ncbi:hypothetical protein F5X68DRAFT_192586 [Plectosphaerella plurivora]|uniref:Uncharacterized protein n=1 Tax=Plectosphaerella plurivora TaxID=936078 RepID=A0A9P8V8T2_9PEZI|nr:hypothetical protein F5X68DRAFT_192586 [Plectosphaerella plurivora]
MPPEAYDVASEVRPSHEFFHPRVSEAVETADQALRTIQQSLQKAALDCPDDADLTALNARAAAMSSRQMAMTRRVAIVGDSGQGKSSLINSLLHMPGVAQTSDMGSACTTVVIEYHQKSEHQISPIEMTAEFYTGDALEEQIRELSWSYRQLLLPGVDRDEMSEKEYERFEKESKEAWEALNSAFEPHQQFSEKWLKDLSEGAADRINAQFIQWAHAIEWPKGDTTKMESSALWRSEAEDADECCRKTAAFMSEGLWPFTKIIEIYLSSPVLDSGLILADLPGLRDTNLARVKATQEYLLRCDRILIVTKIARAITDQSVQSTLFSAVSRHIPMEWEESGGKNLKLAVVCTEADRINPRTAIHEHCGDGKPISKQELRNFEADINAAKGARDDKQRKKAEKRLKFALSGARSKHVSQALQKRYASDTGGKLDVFCVGNHAYEKYCERNDAALVRASGIPSLRRYCFTVTANDRLVDARSWIQTSVPGLLNSAELWASSMIAEGPSGWDKAMILKEFNAIRAKAPEHAIKLQQDSTDCFREQIIAMCNAQGGAWMEAAATKSKEWAGWPWNSYRAWCRRNGSHQTPSRGQVNWNSDLAWKMRSELAFAWDLVFEEVASIYGRAAQSMSKHLARFQEETISKISALEQRRMLLASVESTKQTWVHGITREGQAFAIKLGHIKKRASEANESSYIVTEMLSTYRTASADKGTGIFMRQKACIEGRISDGTLFPNIAMTLWQDVEEVSREAAHAVAALVEETLGKLGLDIEITLNDKARRSGPVPISVGELKGDVLALKVQLEGIEQF